MVLVDTSVWIRSLAGSEPFTRELRRLLNMDQVAGHELVYGELLIGDIGGRKKILTGYHRMFQSSIVPHMDVVAFVEVRKLHGRGIGWIDVHLLASALVSRLSLWTADSRLSVVADEFGVGHRIAG
jgi:predicted nucleic acid-binding protein